MKINWNNELNIIALLGLIISILNSLYLYLMQRKKIQLYLFNLETFETSLYYKYIFQILIENKSGKPISINSIKLIDNNGLEYNCNNSPEYIKESTYNIGNNTIWKNTQESFNFPINIESYHSVSGYIVFNFPKDKYNMPPISGIDPFKIFIGTNRGKTIKVISIREI